MNPKMSKILLPVEFSERWRPAARYAEALASHFQAELVRSYSKSYDYAGRARVPGPRMRRGCANVGTHLAHVASGRVMASRSTKSQRRRN
jgi:hypothetical protein